MMFGENDCIWCGKTFQTKEKHDEHYYDCANEHHIEPDEDEIFDIINNPNNY